MGRRLGQHFLRDPRILDRIVDGVEPGPGDTVLEIGAGLGDLTRRLVPRCGVVHAIELDPLLFQQLTASDLNQIVMFHEGDALALDWHSIVAGGPFKVIGNIPYYVTSPLIEKALQSPPPTVFVFLVQAEVARRLAAPPGSKAFGALTVGVGAVASVENLFTVKPGSFSVPPRVDSVVVRFRPLTRPLIEEGSRRDFRIFVNALFSRRRKQLQRILKSIGAFEDSAVPDVLRALGIDPAARPETLQVSQFVEIFRAASPR